MKHFYFLLALAGLLCFSGQTSAQSADSCGCVNCPAFMPDNFTGTFYFNVNTAANNELADSVQGVCGVRIQFDHEYLGDLQMTLTSPFGQSVQLIGPAGFFGTTDASSWNVMFVPCAAQASPDQGFAPVWNNNQSWGEGNQYDGSYYPNVGCLENFDTGSVTGIWRLDVIDAQAIDVGSIYDFQIQFCDTTDLDCQDCAGPPLANLQVGSSGWLALFDNNSFGAFNYQLDFGDSTFYAGPNFPNSHFYADTGSYVLRLIASNSCGSDTIERTVYIAGSLPTAQVAPLSADNCAPLEVQMIVFQSDHVDEWHWLLPGAEPAESFEMAPSFVYDTAGLYFITLIISNVVGSDTLTIPIVVGGPLVQPGFTVAIQGDSIIATNTTQGFSNIYWSLDGGPVEPGTGNQQVFTVDSSGTYLVTLYVENECDTAVVEQTVPVILTGTGSQPGDIFAFTLQPNPNNGLGWLEIVSPESLPAVMVILNAAGQVLRSQTMNVPAGKTAHELDLSRLPPGFYTLRLQTAAGFASIAFIRQR